MRKVAQTSLSLPCFGLGTAHLGELYGKVDEAQSRATLETAWRAGIRYFDTAPWYGRGLAEHRLGGFLRTLPRRDFIITTKVGRTLHRPACPATFGRTPWAGGLNFDTRFDYSYDGIMRAYEQSLQRLALDTLDALIIHDLEVSYHGKEQARHLRDLENSGMKALEELKGSGEIKAIGCGINTSDTLCEIVRRLDLDFCLVAMPYTLLDQGDLDEGMNTCAAQGVSVIIGAPFASGILVSGSRSSGAYGYAKASDAIRGKVRAIEAVCEEYGVALPAAALQFVLAHPAVVSVIPGAAKPVEVTQNLVSLQVRIPALFWQALREKKLIDPRAPVPS
jgi:D-threo-aldose 1-dehydrogenase